MGKKIYHPGNVQGRCFKSVFVTQSIILILYGSLSQNGEVQPEVHRPPFMRSSSTANSRPAMPLPPIPVSTTQNPTQAVVTPPEQIIPPQVTPSVQESVSSPKYKRDLVSVTFLSTKFLKRPLTYLLF